MIIEVNRGVTLFHYAVVNFLSALYPGHTFFDDFRATSSADVLHYSVTDAYIVEIKSEKETKKTNEGKCNKPAYNYDSFLHIRKEVESLALEYCIARWLIHLAQLWNYGETLKLDTSVSDMLIGRSTYLQLAFPKCYVYEIDDAIKIISSKVGLSCPNVERACSSTDNIAIYTFPQTVLNDLFTGLM